MKTEKANYLVFIKTANKSAIAQEYAVKLIPKIDSKVNTLAKDYEQVFRVTQARMETGKVNLLHLSNL